MARTRARRRWAWALAFVLAMIALAVPFAVARRQGTRSLELRAAVLITDDMAFVEHDEGDIGE